jgi:hypothetical protein
MARDPSTQDVVAVKKISLSQRDRRDVDPEHHRANVMREANTMRQLASHPNVR